MQQRPHRCGPSRGKSVELRRLAGQPLTLIPQPTSDQAVHARRIVTRDHVASATSAAAAATAAAGTSAAVIGDRDAETSRE